MGFESPSEFLFLHPYSDKTGHSNNYVKQEITNYKGFNHSFNKIAIYDSLPYSSHNLWRRVLSEKL